MSSGAARPSGDAARPPAGDLARAPRGSGEATSLLLRALAADLAPRRRPARLLDGRALAGPHGTIAAPAERWAQGHRWQPLGWRQRVERLAQLLARPRLWSAVCGTAVQPEWRAHPAGARADRPAPAPRLVERLRPGRDRRRAAGARRPLRRAGPVRRAEPRPARRAADRAQLLLGRHPRGADRRRPGSSAGIPRRCWSSATSRSTATSRARWRSRPGAPPTCAPAATTSRRRWHLLGVRARCGTAPRSRVTGFEILPLDLLDRPPVDVTLRISGFFRDAFPALIDLFDRAVPELSRRSTSRRSRTRSPPRVRADEQALVSARRRTPRSRAAARAIRVFGSKPGAYGAGLQALIDERGWKERCRPRARLRGWGGYAYGGAARAWPSTACSSSASPRSTLVLHNQDNREHDLLDSDDYYQFEGGLTAAVRHLSGEQPEIYHNDHSRPETPRIRTLRGGDRAHRARPRGQPQVADRRDAPRLQGRVRDRRDGRLPVRLRRHGAVWSRTTISRRCTRPMSTTIGSRDFIDGGQPGGPARNRGALPGSDRARSVAPASNSAHRDHLAALRAGSPD